MKYFITLIGYIKSFKLNTFLIKLAKLVKLHFKNKIVK